MKAHFLFAVAENGAGASFADPATRSAVMPLANDARCCGTVLWRTASATASTGGRSPNHARKAALLMSSCGPR
jgi:hypothetical protein